MDEAQNFSNVTYSINDILESLEALGPQMQIFLITLYSLTALMALGGNATVIVVLLLGKRSSRELRTFLINLAVSDVCMALFSIPFTYTDFMLGRWIFHPIFCPFVQFMQHVSVVASVYTLTAIGLDRYYAIMYPLSLRWTKSRGPVIMTVIWGSAIGLSSFQFIHGKAEKFTVRGYEFYDCTEVWEELDGKVYTASVFIITFILPMLVLTFTYSSIGWKMWRHTSPGNADASRDHQQLMAKIKVVKMMATVVILFAVCWLPIHVFNLLIYFDRLSIMPVTDAQFQHFTAAFFSCHWISMANSFVNPIIYCFMSENFRTDLKQLVFCCCCTHKPHRTAGRLKNHSDHSSFRTTTLVMSSCSVKNVSNSIPLRSLHVDMYNK
ncbi:neuropeptide Y receptor type 5-like [Uloborus diversus]|uniref:neuropeptide Y receptor type 5-like n=1 Tax=Uloborus diversus TaxID=327109 RepID=UPI0024099BE2|nr:neuropeptide Y receptor type 5-like [Uloborus diversus]